jgi:hypothetical protein
MSQDCVLGWSQSPLTRLRWGWSRGHAGEWCVKKSEGHDCGRGNERARGHFSPRRMKLRMCSAAAVTAIISACFGELGCPRCRARVGNRWMGHWVAARHAANVRVLDRVADRNEGLNPGRRVKIVSITAVRDRLPWISFMRMNGRPFGVTAASNTFATYGWSIVNRSRSSRLNCASTAVESGFALANDVRQPVVGRTIRTARPVPDDRPRCALAGGANARRSGQPHRHAPPQVSVRIQRHVPPQISHANERRRIRDPARPHA